jgi:hypothetical protein
VDKIVRYELIYIFLPGHKADAAPIAPTIPIWYEFIVNGAVNVSTTLLQLIKKKKSNKINKTTKQQQKIKNKNKKKILSTCGPPFNLIHCRTRCHYPY